MPLMALRMTGHADTVRTIMNLLQRLDGVAHVEEIADLMGHLDDADSSSAGVSDLSGPGTHTIEIDVLDETVAGHVHQTIEALAFELNAVVEFDIDTL